MLWSPDGADWVMLFAIHSWEEAPHPTCQCKEARSPIITHMQGRKVSQVLIAGGASGVGEEQSLWGRRRKKWEWTCLSRCTYFRGNAPV